MKEKTMKKEKTALRLITREEKPYCGVQSRRLCRLTGCLGRMQAKQYAGSDRLELTWKGPGDGPETEECREDLGRAAETLLSGDPEDGMEGRSLLTGYCFARRGERGPDPHRYRFRIDTEKYAYLTYMRQYRSGLYLLDFRCYRKDLLDRHLERAANGIRFTDRTGRELFVLPDGGRIRLTYPDGRVRDETCRYTDPYHMEIGPGPMNLFHARGFAEMAEEEGFSVEPLDRMPAV